MGKIKTGILSAVSGKVGPVVGATFRGQAILRAAPGKRKGQPTEKQLDQQARFKAAANFLRPLRNVIELGFTDLGREITARNAAQSLTLDGAITGVYPDYTVDPSNVYIAIGPLENVDNPQAAGAAGGIINFTWLDNSGQSVGMDANDRALLVAYNVTTRRCTFISGSAMRNAGAASLVAPHFAGQTVHTWIAFMSETGKRASDSIYTGAVTLP